MWINVSLMMLLIRHISCGCPIGGLKQFHRVIVSDEMLTHTTVPFNSNHEVMCITDQSDIAVATTVKCSKSGIWELPSVCKTLPCPSLRVSHEMSVTYSPNSANHVAGTVAMFSCLNDQFLIGNDNIKCTSKGIWSGPTPKCGTYVKMELKIGQTALMTCKKSAHSLGCTVVSWLFDGKLIGSSRIARLPNVNISANIVSIKKFNELSAGRYTCCCIDLTRGQATTLIFDVMMKTDDVQVTLQKSDIYSQKKVNDEPLIKYKLYGNLKNKKVNQD